MKIGVFDSGIGGITVLNEAMKVLPEIGYLYYADTQNVPYGIKSKEEVKGYVNRAVKFIIDKKVDALVIACNTATSVAVNDLRNNYNIPIIGMEPAVKPAVEKNKDKKVLVLATPLTLKEDKYHNLVSRLDKYNIVESLAIPELVEYAEKFQFDERFISSFLEKKFRLYNLNCYGTMVLGCTHFIYYKSLIKRVIPGHIDLIDGNAGTVRHLKNVLLKNNDMNDMEDKKNFNVNFEFYSSGRRKDNNKLEKYLSLLQN